METARSIVAARLTSLNCDDNGLASYVMSADRYTVDKIAKYQNVTPAKATSRCKIEGPQPDSGAPGRTAGATVPFL